MPVSKSAEKQVRVSARRNERNKSVKSAVRTNMVKAEKLIASGEMESAARAVTVAVSSLDRAAEKGVIHGNSASRRKSSIMRKLNQAATKPQTEGAK